MIFAAAIEPPGRECALEQGIAGKPVLAVDQHGLDVQRLAILAVERNRPIGRVASASARLIRELVALRIDRDLPIAASDRGPAPGEVRNGGNDPLRGNERLAP